MHDKINVCLLNDSFPPVIDGVANAVVNYGEIISTKNLGKATVVTPELKISRFRSLPDSFFPVRKERATRPRPKPW